MKKIILICIFACYSLQLISQTRVSGVVKDDTGLELIGVNIVQRGTFIGTVTDIEGRFSLELDDQQSKVLQVSYIGYEQIQVDVSSRSYVEITLYEMAVGLEEVVVVGFATQQKASLTGSISNVGNQELREAPVSSVTNALAGRIPGLVTRQETGRPGGDESRLFIRGRASLNDTDPLVLVDGVERNFNQIDVEDIESISVLKDASATAVYGVRGANGVILVTTKRGQIGRPRISFSSEFGSTEFNRIRQALNSEYTSLFQREGTINVGLDPSIISNTSNFRVAEYDNYLYRTQLSPFTHPDNNFVDIFTKPGNQQRYNFNISGGNRMLRYFVAVGYFTQDGMFQTDVDEIRKHPTLQRLIELSPEVDRALVNPDYNPEYLYKRLTTRSNIDIAVTDDLKLGVDMSFRFGHQNRPGTYDAGLTATGPEAIRLFAMFYRNAPQIFPIVNPNGSYAGAVGVWRQNPLVTLANTGFKKEFDNQLTSSLSADYDMGKFLEGLSVTGKYSFDVDWGNWRGMIRRPYLYAYNPANDTYLQGLDGVLPTSNSGRTAPTYNKYGELALRYRQTFAGNHNVSAVVLGNYSSLSTPGGGEYSYVPHVYQALIGRVNYDYDLKYLFEVNMGYNGSNRFAKGRRYQLFPAASVGWIVTAENFMPETSLLNFLKLRASAGQVGNDKLGGFSYYYISTYGNGLAYSFGETHNARITGIIEGRMANEDITWETATKYNVGIDTRWFDSRLAFNADYFKEDRVDILTNPARYFLSSGINQVAPANIGIVENEGYELELGWNSYTRKDFSWFSRALFANAKNKVVEMGEATKPYDYMYATGHPIGQFMGYHFDGFFSSYEEIAAAPQQFGQVNLRPGSIRYKDLNGDGIIDENDQTLIGYSPVPELTFSLHLGMQFKGFDMSVLLQGASRGSLNFHGIGLWDNTWGNYYKEHNNRWTPETALTANYPAFLQKADENHQNYFLSDYWLLDGTYLRLKNLQIGYRLPQAFLRNTPVRAVRFYANAYNLITWDKTKYFDPESRPDGNSGNFYPQQRIMNFGVNVTF